jgi:hypothetical protein
MDCVPVLSHATTPIYSTTILALNSITRGTIMCAPSPLFEFACCFNLDDDITYKPSHQSNTFCLDAAIPGRTSAHIFDQLLSWLVRIRDANCLIFSPNQYTAPAACAQAFSTVQSESNSPTKINGSRHTPAILSCNLFLGLSSNQAQSATKPSRPLALITINLPPFNIRVLF